MQQRLAARRLFQINDTALDFIFTTAFSTWFWIYLSESWQEPYGQTKLKWWERKAASDQLNLGLIRKMNVTNHLKAGGWAWLAWAACELLLGLSWVHSCELVAVSSWLDLSSLVPAVSRADSTGWEERAGPTEHPPQLSLEPKGVNCHLDCFHNFNRVAGLVKLHCWTNVDWNWNKFDRLHILYMMLMTRKQQKQDLTTFLKM